MLTSSSCSEFWWEARRLPTERWNDSTWPSSILVLGYDVSIFVDASQLRNVSSQAYKKIYTNKPIKTEVTQGMHIILQISNGSSS